MSGLNKPSYFGVLQESLTFLSMGKGDVKTRKGKIARGSHGNTRPQKVDKPSAPKPEAKPTPKP